MKARKPAVGEGQERQDAALRDLVRLLARQAAAEFVRDNLQDGAGRR